MWQVRNDVSLRFLDAFYRALDLKASPGRPLGRGRAYRAAVQAIYDWTGAERTLLWAPFALAGVAE